MAGESAPARAGDPTQPAPVQKVRTLGPHLWPTLEWRPTTPDLDKRSAFRGEVASDPERSKEVGWGPAGASVRPTRIVRASLHCLPDCLVGEP